MFASPIHLSSLHEDLNDITLALIFIGDCGSFCDVVEFMVSDFGCFSDLSCVDFDDYTRFRFSNIFFQGLNTPRPFQMTVQTEHYSQQPSAFHWQAIQSTGCLGDVTINVSCHTVYLVPNFRTFLLSVPEYVE